MRGEEWAVDHHVTNYFIYISFYLEYNFPASNSLARSVRENIKIVGMKRKFIKRGKVSRG
jgi:hypothetical protein